MQSNTTSVFLPPKLPYPLTVGKVDVKQGDVIERHARIFTYRYSDFEPVPLSERTDDDDDNDSTTTGKDTDKLPRKKIKVEYVGSYECPLAGRIQEVNVKPGDVIESNSHSLLQISEPCTHPIQYGGLCAICGKAVDDSDYTGFNDKDRAPISMVHGTTNLKVSTAEAANIERGSTERLLKDKKLSLVVDLDQTVIHATVDPTVEEWMSDPSNPNYRALKDVKTFYLAEPTVPPPGYTGPPLAPSVRCYYVKLRPGLHEFLEKVSKIYEMHIYTMATRSYAKQIGKIIDPDGVYFGDRILSRDESGSLTQKSLKRLFPVDTSMVVVIDDRGDVWNWSPNLIKVVPYDFFVGIGDINSSFLPRQHTLMGPSKRRRSVDMLEEKLHKDSESENDDDDDDNKENDENDKHDEEEKENDEKEEHDHAIPDRKALQEEAKVKAADESAIDDDDDDPDITVEDESTRKIEKVDPAKEAKKLLLATQGAKITKSKDDKKESHINVSVSDQSSSPVDRMVELTEGDNSGELLAMQANERSTALEQQQNERPLAKMQQNLVKILEEEEETKNTLSPTADTTQAVVEQKEPYNLLVDDDGELSMLSTALTKIHDKFYDEYANDKGTEKTPDVKDIMTKMKQVIFKGCVFLLSGILPLGTSLDSAEIVTWSKSFGATFVTEYNTSVTHVICKNPGTFKVRLAKSVDPNVKIVNPDWLFSCMSKWKRVPEKEYEVKVTNLLDKKQVDNFLKYHNHIESSTADVSGETFDTSNLDWDEIDKEMREFMGPEYDDDMDDEKENAGKNDKPGKDDHPEAKPEANTDENSDGKADGKADGNPDKSTESSTAESADGNANGNSDTTSIADMSDDEYEKEILNDLADLEEDDGKESKK